MICRLIALDLDGTLLNSKKMISPASVSALQSAQQAGVKIILATGRSHSEALPYYQQLQLTEPMICCNGSYLYHPRQRQILRPLPLDTQKVEQLRRWFLQPVWPGSATVIWLIICVRIFRPSHNLMLNAAFGSSRY
ncbi:HAD-IIB family hydrolase, partial [Escherichia coli]